MKINHMALHHVQMLSLELSSSQHLKLNHLYLWCLLHCFTYSLIQCSLIFHSTERISGAFISTSSNQPVEGNSFNLTCDAGGSVFGRKWMKNSSPLLQDESITIHDMGRVLSFYALEKRHKGDYSCNISNPINSEEVVYNMVVNCG